MHSENLLRSSHIIMMMFFLEKTGIFPEISSAECKSIWGNAEGNSSHHYPRGILCRLAKGMGSLSPRKRGLGSK